MFTNCGCLTIAHAIFRFVAARISDFLCTSGVVINSLIKLRCITTMNSLKNIALRHLSFRRARISPTGLWRISVSSILPACPSTKSNLFPLVWFCAKFRLLRSSTTECNYAKLQLHWACTTPFPSILQKRKLHVQDIYDFTSQFDDNINISTNQKRK